MITEKERLQSQIDRITIELKVLDDAKEKTGVFSGAYARLWDERVELKFRLRGLEK